MGRRQWVAAVLFAPSLAVVGIFVYGFIGFSIRVSVAARYTALNPDLSTTPGLLDNYGELLSNQRFQADLRNIVILTVGILMSAIVLGMCLALLVHATARASGLFRSVFLLPYALSFIVTGVVWRWLFTPGTGVNRLLEISGLSHAYEALTGQALAPGWITDPSVVGDLGKVIGALFPSFTSVVQTQLGIPVAIIPVVLAASWQTAGFAMALFLAGLGAIPDEVTEAARVDGAGGIRLFWSITLPMLKGTIVVTVVLLTHTALKSFDLVYSMVGTGPGFATDVPGIFVYDQMFRALHYNTGAAASVVMLVLVSLIVVPYLARNFAKEENL